MANVDYIGLEIASSLVYSYENLALRFKRTWESEQSRGEAEFHAPSDSNSSKEANSRINYQGTFALLLLNAAIVEGTLRSTVSERVMEDIKAGVKKARAQGRTGPTKAEALLLKEHIAHEVTGGWARLKEYHDFYFDKNLGSALGQDLNESMEVLFQLRNVLAHGTALVQPKTKMDESMKDMYPYKWQTGLQRTVVYLEKTVDNTKNLFENLADPSVPQHFWEKSQAVFEAFEKEFSPIPERALKTMNMVRQLSFGYRFHT